MSNFLDEYFGHFLGGIGDAAKEAGHAVGWTWDHTAGEVGRDAGVGFGELFGGAPAKKVVLNDFGEPVGDPEPDSPNGTGFKTPPPSSKLENKRGTQNVKTQNIGNVQDGQVGVYYTQNADGKYVKHEGTPNYEWGDQNTTWKNLDPDQRMQLKQELLASNMYTAEEQKHVFGGGGLISPADVNALQRAMNAANLNGIGYGDYLARASAAGQENQYKQGLSYANVANGVDQLGQLQEQQAQFTTTMKDFVNKNGIELGDHWYQNEWQRMIDPSMAASGKRPTIDTLQNDLRDTYIARAYPAWEKQIKAGQDVRTLADPYIQSMASILELNPNDVKLDDPHIKNAIQGKEAIPLNEFETTLRQDPRWGTTKNAMQFGAQFKQSLDNIFQVSI